MGCFLACFGSSKDRRRGRRHSPRKVQPRIQRNASFKPVHVQPTVSIEQDSAETLITPVPELLCRDKPEEQVSLSTRKKVTFDSNVRTYEHVSHDEDEDADCVPESNEGGKEEEGNSEKPSKSPSLSGNLVKSTQSQSSSEDSSITSLGSYPPSHRYQNCRESDDEGEDMEFEDSDLEDDEDDDSDGFYEDDDDDGMVKLRTKICADKVITEELDGPETMCGLSEEEAKPIGSSLNARDRSLYVHPVLNPVENLSQWKAVKAKGKPPLKHQKENITSDQEPRISFSSEPGFKELSFSFKSKSNQTKSSNSDIAVDASLSNWLVSPETTPPMNRTSTFGFDTSTPEKSKSPGSSSMISHEDRPILGALTVEEIRQFSASSSPRKSPSRSPDDMPIIGTVGTYWSHTDPAKGSGSASSYKGIPNTTSKYREDKKVNWHSTPFETRLERALERSAAAKAYPARTPGVC